VKYLSVCSGIEAATVAWHGLGWTPVAFSEIEAFPAAVLAHHYPTVPNLGDLTKYREWPEELLVEVDLLVGGTPCQAFSVAGKRQSLDDERGNLSLIYVNLYHHINEVRKRHGRPPAIALWENVPGVLSTKDNAFGCFIGGLLGCDEAPQTESGKWDKAGFLSSETVRVGYRVLDAQYFGVAQRRRRVFLAAVPCELVERFGERACPSEILSLRESVLGNPPTRGAAWEGASRATAAGLTSSGRGVERPGESRGQDDVVIAGAVAPPIAGCSNGGGPNGPGRTADDAESLVIWSASDQANAERLVDQAGTLNCNMGQRGGWIAGHPDPAYAISAGNQSKGGVFGSGRDSQDTFVTCFHPTQDPISSTDGSTAVPAVAFTKAKRAQSATDDESWVPGDVAPTQNQFDQGDTRATTVVAFTHSGYSNQPAWITGSRTDCISSAGHSDGSHQGIGVVAFRENQRAEVEYVDPPHALASGGGKPGQGYCGVQLGMQVRRLTPKECSFLQGFPADYLDITFRKKPAADGPKYRALGNSMAVPCMWWLGYRIHHATGPHK
jgi:DNA (cytosine-5)-methyltransferase 1